MKPSKILLFIAAAIASLTIIALIFPADGITIGSKTLHFPSVKKIIIPQKELDLMAYLEEEQRRTEEHKHELNGMQDSADYYRQIMESGDMRFWFPNGDADYFVDLYEAFKTVGDSGDVVHILHYGDSQIEMDRLSNRLRAYMQRNFGGNGPGLLPFMPVIRSLSVQHSASGALTHVAAYGDAPRANGHYGPLVNTHQLLGEAVATFSIPTSRNVDSALMSYSRVKLLFNNHGGTLHATVATKEGVVRTQSSSTPGVGSLSWNLDAPTTRVRLTVSGNADLYGVVVDGNGGVAVDNIPLRGCSGQQFTMINQNELTAAYGKMNIGLIIMQFGGNSVPYIKGDKALTTYASSLARQVDRVHECCPNAKILFIGPSDMSTSRGGEYVTYPFLPKIVAGIRDSVTAHGAAFWSLYDAMGGENSMPVWVKQGMAGSDYIHYSQKGADIMGDRIATAFDNAFKYCDIRLRMRYKEQAFESSRQEQPTEQ
ncbi:MAG: hypothetical protein II793_03150 [Bacteroidales bacterium]|nr:hypothetical protein [Bacteroidales bacterium]